jgi:hypothetical protein
MVIKQNHESSSYQSNGTEHDASAGITGAHHLDISWHPVRVWWSLVDSMPLVTQPLLLLQTSSTGAVAGEVPALKILKREQKVG